MRGGRHRGRCGRGFRGRVPSREEQLEFLEERQRDLEEELADIADLLKRLKDEPTPAATTV